MSEFQRVALVGCGTIGLPCAVAFATRGVSVFAVDIDVERVARLSKGCVDRLDEGLAQALAAAISNKSIAFGNSIVRASGPTAFVIAVQTPVDREGRPVRRHFRAAADAVLACARPGDLIALRSTVPIGTTRELADETRSRGLNLLVAACPDRSVSGDNFREQFSVPAIVGGVDAESTRAAADLFARLGPAIPVASSEAAEAVKLFCNVQRDIQFATANEFALACERLGLDFEEIRRAGARMYPRFSLARQGPVGGDCLSKDGFLLASSLGGSPASLPLALSARRLNLSLVDFVATAVCEHVETMAPLRPVVAILGIAFKGEPATLDQRDSFGAALAEAVRGRLQNVEVRTWDPAMSSGEDDDLRQRTVSAADAVVLANDHPLLTRMDLGRTAAQLRRGALIYDVCGRDLDVSGRLPNAVVLHGFGRRFAGGASVCAAPAS